MAHPYRPAKNRLPAVQDQVKSKDNRSLAAKIFNHSHGIIPLQTKKGSHCDSIIDFAYPQHEPTVVLPTFAAPHKSLSPAMTNAIKALPAHVQKQLITVPTKYTTTAHQAVQNTIKQLPMAIALAPSTIPVYASYFMSFLSWTEAVLGLPTTPSQRHSANTIFAFCRDLIAAEYNDPVIYYNTVLAILLQSQTPAGERLLILDAATSLDVESHRSSLDRYKRKYMPDQAPILTKRTFQTATIAPKQVAMLLVWIYTASRISSMESMTILHTHRNQNGIIQKIVFHVTHLKGSLSNTETTELYCNCPVFPESPLGHLYCPLHSPAYAVTILVFPIPRSELLAAAAAAKIMPHSPRVTAAVAIRALKECSPYHAFTMHLPWINALFYWKGEADTMFEYYSRGFQKLLKLAEFEPLALPMNAFIRHCAENGWTPDGAKIRNTVKKSVALPGHMMEILATPLISTAI